MLFPFSFIVTFFLFVVFFGESALRRGLRPFCLSGRVQSLDGPFPCLVSDKFLPRRRSDVTMRDRPHPGIGFRSSLERRNARNSHLALCAIGIALRRKPTPGAVPGASTPTWGYERQSCGQCTPVSARDRKSDGGEGGRCTARRGRGRAGVGSPTPASGARRGGRRAGRNGLGPGFHAGSRRRGDAS